MLTTIHELFTHVGINSYKRCFSLLAIFEPFRSALTLLEHITAGLEIAQHLLAMQAVKEHWCHSQTVSLDQLGVAVSTQILLLLWCICRFAHFQSFPHFCDAYIAVHVCKIKKVCYITSAGMSPGSHRQCKKNDKICMMRQAKHSTSKLSVTANLQAITVLSWTTVHYLMGKPIAIRTCLINLRTASSRYCNSISVLCLLLIPCKLPQCHVNFTPISEPWYVDNKLPLPACKQWRWALQPYTAMILRSMVRKLCESDEFDGNEPKLVSSYGIDWWCWGPALENFIHKYMLSSERAWMSFLFT